MDENTPDTLVVASYAAKVTARADADVVRDGEQVAVPTIAELQTVMQDALAEFWPNLTFNVSNVERTDR